MFDPPSRVLRALAGQHLGRDRDGVERRRARGRLLGRGAYLTSSLLDKTMPVNISAGMEFLIGEPLDAEHPVMTIFQSFFDRSRSAELQPADHQRARPR